MSSQKASGMVNGLVLAAHSGKYFPFQDGENFDEEEFLGHRIEAPNPIFAVDCTDVCAW